MVCQYKFYIHVHVPVFHVYCNMVFAFGLWFIPSATVLDVEYSPTGKEFVSGSYDKSIRIFPVHHNRSRYFYTTVFFSGQSHRFHCIIFEYIIRWLFNACTCILQYNNINIAERYTTQSVCSEFSVFAGVWTTNSSCQDLMKRTFVYGKLKHQKS